MIYITVKNTILFSLFVLATVNVISSAVFQTKTMTKKNSVFYSNVYHTILLGDFFFLDYIVEFKQDYL